MRAVVCSLCTCLLLSALAAVGLPASPARAQDPAEAPPAASSPAPQVTVSLHGVSPGLTSIPQYAVLLKLHNNGLTRCAVTSYQLRWDGGGKRIHLQAPITIAPGASIDRRADLGDFGPLGDEAEAERRVASMTVEVACE